MRAALISSLTVASLAIAGCSAEDVRPDARSDVDSSKAAAVSEADSIATATIASIGDTARRTRPSTIVYRSDALYDAESMREAVGRFYAWCADGLKNTAVSAPRFKSKAFVNRDEGFGLWAVTGSDRVTGGWHDGVCESYLRRDMIAMLANGEAELIEAAGLALGMPVKGSRARSKGGWPVWVMKGESTVVGAPIIVRFMRKKPGSSEGERGDVKLSIGLWDKEV